MTNVNLADTAASVAAAVATPAKRRPAVSQADFLAGLNFGSSSTPKLTAVQVAEHLNMDKGSFDQRLNQIRMQWRGLMVVILLKQAALLAEINEVCNADFTQTKLDELTKELKEDGTYDGTSIDDDFLTVPGTVAGKPGRSPKPFPFTLADGRGEGNGGGGKRVETARNAIFAAMQKVDAKSAPKPAEPDAE